MVFEGAGANVVLHSAGWLERGLVSCFEKYIIDTQILEQLIAEFQPIEFTDDDLAFGAHDEVRHGRPATAQLTQRDAPVPSIWTPLTSMRSHPWMKPSRLSWLNTWPSAGLSWTADLLTRPSVDAVKATVSLSNFFQLNHLRYCFGE